MNITRTSKNLKTKEKYINRKSIHNLQKIEKERIIKG